MKRLTLLFAVALVLAATTAGWSHFKKSLSGSAVTDQAAAFVDTLSAEQKQTAVLKYGTPLRLDWHFIPKNERKGLQIKHMEPNQRKAALSLLRSCLSKSGYSKATRIMALEGVLAELESDKKGGNIRDPERYYFTLFGEPNSKGRWGLSIEGHHLSLNFVVENNEVISSTPAFFATNPATFTTEIAGHPKGYQVLKQEEMLGFELMASLTQEQQKQARLAEKAPAEIRAAGEAQPPTDAPEGVKAESLDKKQMKLLKQLIGVYARSMPSDVAEQRISAIEAAGPRNIHFAWAGATKPGIGHYYRVQGPTFLIEFVNVQPDAAGNPANHVHCVWRDMHGDFALPIK